MTGPTRRGQAETSFQWMFVLIAGIALLLLLLGVARGCARSGEQQGTAGDLRATASRLASASWEGSSVQNITLPQARVDCRAGVITLQAESAQEGLDRVPVYLPPFVGGRAQLETRSLSLGAGTPAPFPLGGLSYVLDAQTTYLLIQDTGGLGERLMGGLPGSPSIIPVTLADLDRPGAIAKDVPGSPRAIVIAIVGTDADLTRIDLTGLPPTAEVRGVALRPRESHGGSATFYALDAANGHLSATGTAPYAHELIGLGMIVAADRDVARCASDAFADRARTITTIAARRSDELAAEVADGICGQLLGQGAGLLAQVSARPGNAAFLDQLVGAEPDIIALQGNLLTRPGDCPGLA